MTHLLLFRRLSPIYTGIFPQLASLRSDRSPSFIPAPPRCQQVSIRCHRVSVRYSEIILEYLMDVCLGPATVWQRCRLIFDLVSVCTVCCPRSLLHAVLIDDACLCRALGRRAWPASLRMCTYVWGDKESCGRPCGELFSRLFSLWNYSEMPALTKRQQRQSLYIFLVQLGLGNQLI